MAISLIPSPVKLGKPPEFAVVGDPAMPRDYKTDPSYWDESQPDLPFFLRWPRVLVQVLGLDHTYSLCDSDGNLAKLLGIGVGGAWK